MADQVIGFEITAELSAFRAELAKIPDIGEKEAKALAAQFQRQLKATEKAAREAAAATRKVAEDAKAAGAGLRAAEQAASGFGQTGAKLAGVLDMVDPRLGAVARGMADLGDVGEVATGAAGRFGVSLTAIGAAAVPLALLLAGIGASLKYDADQADAAAEATEALADAMRKVEAARAGNVVALDDLRARVGLISPEEAKYRKELDASRAAHAEQTAEIEKAIEARKAAGGDWGKEVKALRDQQEALQASQEERELLLAADREYSTELRKSEEFLDARAKAEKRAAEAAERMERAVSATNAAMAAETSQAERSLATWQRSTDATSALIDEQRRALATEEERIELDREAARATADRLLQERLSVSATLSAEETAYQEHKAALSAIDERYDAEQAQRREKNSAATEAAAVQSTEMYGQAVQMAGQLLDDLTAQAGQAYATAVDTVIQMTEYQAAAEGHLTEAQQAELARRLEAQKDAARAAFDAQKALALAGAIVNTAQGVTQALASAPPPLSFVNAALVGAAGAVEIGTIVGQQPAFHKGGALDLQPDEMAITARRREFVLNPTGRGVMGDEQLHKANAGVPSGGGQVVAVSVYRHTRQVDRWKSDGLLQGDPIAAAISEGRLVGHRGGTR